jgi:hypothetical protein
MTYLNREARRKDQSSIRPERSIQKEGKREQKLMSNAHTYITIIAFHVTTTGSRTSNDRDRYNNKKDNAENFCAEVA